MSNNIIFAFTGTGNSLWVAKEVSKILENSKIVSMGSCTQYSLDGKYDTIGFIYPTYYRGIPLKVREFVACLDMLENNNSYLYAVATHGEASHGGNSIVHLQQLLKKKNTKLDYAEHLDMFSNYVALYDMRDTVEEEAERATIALQPILKNIKERSENKIKATSEPIQQLAYNVFAHFVSRMDKNFNISDTCVRCGICKKVCPVNNIEYGKDGKPFFSHRCEQCMGCIQSCPVQAINYKNRTKSRKRYTYPNISWQERAAFNGYRQSDNQKDV